MKKISKIFATALLCVYSSTSFADVSSSKIEALEARIAKMEKESSANQQIISKIETDYSGANKQITDFLKKTKIFGKLQLDKTFVNHNEGNLPLNDNSQLRLGRIGVSGDVGLGWGYKFEVDFAGNATSVTDAYIKKDLCKKAALKIGQFKEPFSLEKLTDDMFTTFLERASITGMTPNRNIGIQYDHHIDHINFAVGAFGDNINNNSTVSGDEAKSLTTRIAFYNQSENKDVVHLGIAYRISQPTGNTVSYNFKPEASIKNVTINSTARGASAISTSNITNTSRINQLGLELAAVSGPFSVQSEYVRTDISGNQSYYIDGYYVQLSSFLTKGDKRSYDSTSSIFGRVKPANTKGAWEIAYRFSQTDANHSGLAKGVINDNTVGLSYYATDNIRFLLNYINVNADKNSVYGGDAQITSLRAQVDF